MQDLATSGGQIATGARGNLAGGHAHYRPDIDGLRAIAVGLVIIFHLAPRFVPNGFVGVDLFFVISGFVVTSSTMRRVPSSLAGTVFSFWKRRVVRIYPALLVCILATSIVSIALMPPFPHEQYRGVLRTGLAAFVGGANIYLLRSQQNYFTADQSLNPFLHMWSLGVEEQFYLLFSLCFLALPVLIARTLGRSTGSGNGVRIWLLFAMTIASAILLARVGQREASIDAYYLLQYRFWELGAGALLAASAPVSGWLPYFARQLASLLLMAAMLLVAVLQTTEAPQVAIVAATLSCTALIWLNSAGDGSSATWAATILAWPPLRAMGLVSYSLYLWHWPVLVFFGLTIGLKSAGAVAVAVAVVAMAAVTSYAAVERPLRLLRGPFWRLNGPLLLALAAIGVGTSIAAEMRPGFAYLGQPQNWTSDWQPAPEFSYAGSGKIVASNCDLSAGSAIPVAPPARCVAKVASAVDNLPSVLVVGDSMAFADWGMLSVGYKDRRFHWSALGHNGCNIDFKETDAPRSCVSYWATMAERVRGSLGNGDYVLIAVLWDLAEHVNLDAAIARLEPVAASARAAGATVVVQAPLPQFSRGAFFCTLEWYRTDYDGCSIGRVAFEARRAGVMAALSALRARHSNVVLWDPIDRLCPDDECREFSNDKPIFRDQDHLSYWGSLSLGREFERAILGDVQARKARPGRATATSAAPVSVEPR